jgi:hypothetical protein
LLQNSVFQNLSKSRIEELQGPHAAMVVLDGGAFFDWDFFGFRGFLKFKAFNWSLNEN